MFNWLKHIRTFLANHLKILFVATKSFLIVVLTVLSIYCWVSLLGEWSKFLRLEYLGIERELIVDSTWQVLDSPEGKYDLMPYKYFRSKEYNGTIYSLPNDIGFGDTLYTKYHNRSNEYKVINRKSLTRENIGINWLAIYVWFNVIFIIIFVALPSLFDNVFKAIQYVNKKISSTYKEPENLPNELSRTSRVLSYFIQILPSTLSIFINMLFLLLFLRIFLSIKNMNHALLGVLVILFILYTTIIAPKWIKWLYQFKYSEKTALYFIRLIVQIFLGVFLLKELIELFYNANYYYDWPDLAYKVINKIWDFLVN